MSEEAQTQTAASEQADLDVCEQEPLAHSGMIQDTGALLATRPGEQLISHASDNLGRWFDLPEDGDALHLNSLFFDDVNYFGYRQRMLFENRHYLIANVITNRGIEGDITYSRHPSHEIYEFEPKTPGHQVPAEGYEGPPVTIADSPLKDAVDVQTIMHKVHRLTGYPKIMLYRFQEDGSGDVVAELSDGSLDNYQGLRFPASDIPQIARNLYVNNPYRLIFDTRGAASTVQASEGHDAIDLSNSTLRSVSPVHVEYLGNMGVRSSASFPILVMGRLWGLMALHAVEPTPIPITERIAVFQLLQAELSRRVMDARIKAEHQRFNASVDLINQSAALLSEVLGGNALATTAPVKALMECDGLIVRMDGATLYNDTGLDEEACGSVADLGRAQALNNHFATDNLTRFISDSENFRRKVSGINYATTGSELSRGRLEVIWTRAEQSVSVTWAGRPEKIRHEVDGQVRISPRKSFDAWSVDTQGQSRPWASPDILVATKLLVKIMTGNRRRTDPQG